MQKPKLGIKPNETCLLFYLYRISVCNSLFSAACKASLHRRTSGGSSVQRSLLALVVTHTMGLDAEWAAGIISESHPDALAHFHLDNRSWKRSQNLILCQMMQQSQARNAACFSRCRLAAPELVWPQTRSLLHGPSPWHPGCNWTAHLPRRSCVNRTVPPFGKGPADISTNLKLTPKPCQKQPAYEQGWNCLVWLCNSACPLKTMAYSLRQVGDDHSIPFKNFAYTPRWLQASGSEGGREHQGGRR